MALLKLRLIHPLPETAATQEIFRCSNFQALRQSYCTHKGRHLVKHVLIVAPDSYILEIQGLYFSDYYNNDAAILRTEFERDVHGIRRWVQEGDIVIIDRGYRDGTEQLTQLGITYKIPSLLPRRMRQLQTKDANDSRLITKSRWIVEARNGHIKSIFKFLSQTLPMSHVANVGDYYRIAGAIINKYHPTINMEGADVELARELMEKATYPNVVQALVEQERLATTNAQRWVRLDGENLEFLFPRFTMEYLRDLTIGIYQDKLAPSYIQDKLRKDPEEEFEVEMLRAVNNLPEPGLRVFSRFRNAVKYQLWIAFQLDDEDEKLKATCEYMEHVKSSKKRSANQKIK